MATIPNPFAAKGGGLPLTGGTLTGPLYITSTTTTGPLLNITGTGTTGALVQALGTGFTELYLATSSNAAGVGTGIFVAGVLAQTMSDSGNGGITTVGRFISSANSASAFSAASGGIAVHQGVDVTGAGTGLSVARGAGQQGTNSKVGTGSLSAGGGVGTVANTSVTANSYIFITDTNTSVTNVGNLAVISQTAGTNFVVQSSNASDVSSFNYFIVEPG